MGKQEKLIEKFRRQPPPVDFKFEDLVTLLGFYGFVLKSKAGSHSTFICQTTGTKIKTTKPHPNNVLKTYQINEITQTLINMGHFK